MQLPTENSWSIIEYVKCGHISETCTSTTLDPLCSHHILASSSPHFEQNAVSCWKRPKCLNLYVAKTSQSERTCESVSDVCLHESHSGLFTSSSLNKLHFKWDCPIRNPVIILSWFQRRPSNYPALFSRELFKKAFILSFPLYVLPIFLTFPVSLNLDSPLATFAFVPSAG